MATPKYDKEKLEAMRRAYADAVTTMLQTAAEEKKDKVRGISVPVIIKISKKNKPGFGGKESFGAGVQFGCALRAKGPGSIVGPEGKWFMLPLELGKNPNGPVLSHYPVSLVTNQPVKHVLIRSGDFRYVFTDDGDVMLFEPMSTAYIVWLVATLSLIKKKDNVDAPADQRQGGYGQHPERLRKTRGPQIVRPSAAASQHDHASTSSSTTSSTSVSASSTSLIATTDIQDGMVVAACGAVADAKTLEAFAALSDVAAAVETADCSAFCGQVVPASVVDAYRRFPDGGMSREQCLCLEYMHPEVMRVEMPQKAVEEGMSVKFALNCGRVIPTRPLQYALQSRMDIIEMLKKSTAPDAGPDVRPVDTVVTYELLSDRSCPPILLVSRPEPEADRIFIERTAMGPTACPSLVTFRFNIDAVQKPGETTSVSPLVVKSTKTGVVGACIPFLATATSWSEDQSYESALAKHELYNCTLSGRAYEKTVASMFGVLCPNAWIELAPKFLANTTIWFWVVVNHATSARTGPNIGRGMVRDNTRCAVDVTAAMADVATAIADTIGIPITPEGATGVVNAMVAKFQLKELGGQRTRTSLKVPDKSEIDAARPQTVGGCACITEQPDLFAAAIKAGCKFYVVSSAPFNWRERNIQMTPELGAAMLSLKWNESGDVDVPGIGKVGPRDALRDAETRALAAKNTVNYVYAVRQDIAANAARAELAMAVINDGGRYDSSGTPIMIDEPVFPLVCAAPSDSGTPPTQPAAPAVPDAQQQPPQQQHPVAAADQPPSSAPSSSEAATPMDAMPTAVQPDGPAKPAAAHDGARRRRDGARHQPPPQKSADSV
jgi:hypothetical protein